MDEIAHGLLDRLLEDIPVIEKVKMIYWIQKYLWSTVEEELGK